MQQVYMAMKSAVAVKLLLLFLAVTGTTNSQAPGDEAAECTTGIVHMHPDNERTLMDSFSYVDLLPGNGTGHPLKNNAVWNDMSFDNNDIINRTNSTYVSLDIM